MLFFRILILVALLRLLIATGQPFLCSGIYTAVVFLLGLVFGHSFLEVLLGSAIAFVLASVYFWLLDRFEESMLWWVIMLVGFGIGFF